MTTNQATVETPAVPSKSISVTRVFKRSFSQLFRFFPQHLVFMSIYVLPFIAIMAILPESVLSQDKLGEITSIPGIMFYLVQLAVFSVAARAISSFTLEHLNGYRPSLFGAVGSGLVGMLPVYLGTLIFYLGLGLGMILLVVPGLYFAVTYLLVTPAIVGEKLGVKDAFSRSKELMIGYRWKVLFAVILLAVMYTVIQFVGLSVFQLMYLIHDAETVSPAEANSKIPMTHAIGAPMSVFGVIFIATLFHEIQTAKEGGQREEIAAVFD